MSDKNCSGDETMKFRKKPVVIEAVQLRWDTWSEMRERPEAMLINAKKEVVK